MDDIAILCKEVCEEFHQLGFNKDVDSRTLKESYNIVKRPNGQWLKSTKNGLHDAATLSELDFHHMPMLKKLTDLIDERDSEIKKKGGRIFITEILVSKITRGTEQPILFSKTSIEKDKARNQKLCDEIIEHGLERDRYRTEETYILTKAPNGEWSMTSSHENHSGTKKILNLTKMPQLKILANKLNKLDPKFQLNGGRIFITPTRVYRLNNKVEIDFKV